MIMTDKRPISLTYVIRGNDKMVVYIYDALIPPSYFYTPAYIIDVSYTRTEFVMSFSKNIKQNKDLSITMFRLALKELYIHDQD